MPQEDLGSGDPASSEVTLKQPSFISVLAFLQPCIRKIIALFVLTVTILT